MSDAKVKITAVVVLVAVLSVCIWAATKPSGQTSQLSMTITDDLGREITIFGTPERIVSLAPSNTEILFALGLGDKVAGVTAYCDYPPEAAQKEKVGGYSTINIEKVVALNPDLILASGGVQEEVVEQLEGLGVTVVALWPDNLDGILHDITLVGDITGVKDTADALTENLRQRIENIVNAVENASKPEVFYVVWDEPLMTAGQGTFPDDLITRAGGVNIGADAGTSYLIYSLEVLVQQNPSVIILSHGKTPADMASLAGWQDLTAVRENKVFTIDPDITSRPGPRIVDGLEQMARYIHPELVGFG